MYKVDIQADLREAAAVEARRNREKQRQSRIFNARYRTMGVDIEGLKRQVEERKLRENIEKRREEAFGKVQCDKVAQMLEEEEHQRKKQLCQDLVEFREREQQPSTRREWDIHDPEAVRKGQPARVSDDDPRCGPSSMQCFAGEDLNFNNTHNCNLIIRNQVGYVLYRLPCTAPILHLPNLADNLEGKKRIELDLRAWELAQLEEECRRAKAMALADFNRAQAAEVAEQQRVSQQREQDDNYAEIHNHLTGNLLLEDPSVAKSLLGPHRVITDRWKGMSPEQLQAVWQMQKEQCRENQVRDKEGRAEENWFLWRNDCKHGKTGTGSPQLMTTIEWYNGCMKNAVVTSDGHDMNYFKSRATSNR
uniref:RIB43A-like with coiled-coils protein 1 n=1 Tax=Pseudonaja textilis TaxID=8673 RepID=A0A670YB89_PSETE